jgi:His/Glu/Gln/Arg/opine family amino acid ABC transporter permease subunit
VFSENLRESLDLSLFWEYRAILLQGLRFNAYVFAGAGGLAIVLGLLACLARIARSRLLAAAGGVYAELFRNAPEYVLLIWVHYVPPLLLTLALGTKISFTPLFSAIAALGLAYSGYLAETFRAGIEAVPKGHVEAAEALGMTRLRILRRIVLPQAVRHMLPELLNQLVSLFKATTLVSLIAVPDLMYNVSMITSQEMRPLPLYTGAALVYCAIIFVAATGVRVFGDRWRARYL